MPQARAKKLIYDYVRSHLDADGANIDFSEDNVFVVWFNYTLKSWKALISTTLPDGMYYEVTHNGLKHETYIDAYKKCDNVVIPDEVEENTNAAR